MAFPRIAGGWGQTAWGQHEWGEAKSDIEPRFSYSTPQDGNVNTPRDKLVEFEVYYYSSFPAMTEAVPPLFEISEDGGAVFLDASQPPYATKANLLAGHRLWVMIVKAGLWAADSEIVIRTTIPDEFGQAITKESPVRWGS